MATTTGPSSNMTNADNVVHILLRPSYCTVLDACSMVLSAPGTQLYARSHAGEI